MRKFHILGMPLLVAVCVAILSGIFAGLVFPSWLARVFTTFNGLFSNFLSFIIPLLILGLVAPGISALGKQAGKLLFITVVLAYGFTIFSGFFTYFICDNVFPYLLANSNNFSALLKEGSSLKPYFVIDFPPIMSVTSALLLGFILGVGTANLRTVALRDMLEEFRKIIYKIIYNIIIPFLPLYILGIFMDMTITGQVASILIIFVKLIVLIFFITIIMLLIQFTIASTFNKRNPLKMIKTMLPAYFTALGTQSSAATIPVTFAQTIKLGVRQEVASFTIPLCANIHMTGSTMKIVACSLAIILVYNLNIDFAHYAGFIFMLGISIVAAPGVPGGSIMAALGILQTLLGFDEKALGLMIALYIAMDSFGTACNVTGDGAISVIVNRVYSSK